MTSMSWLSHASGLVTKAEIHRFMRDCLVQVGTPQDNATVVADVLLDADCRGHKAHGFNRLALYLREIEAEQCDPSATPTVLNESAATAWVDACNGLGPVVGSFCIDLAIEKAAKEGVSVISVKRSNYMGVSSFYSSRALDRGMIGICCSNTVACLTPTRAKKPFLGSNPLSVAAPSLCGDSFILDMSTSAVPLAMLELYHTIGADIPYGWALDESGHMTTDAEEALRARSLVPLGGLEETGGHKGTGLALMVEALCGVLAGGSCAVDNIHWSDDAGSSRSQFFMAIDPKMFAPGYESRLFDLLYKLREFHSAETGKKITVAGDPERANIMRVESAGGISYHSHQLNQMMTLAELLDVQPVTIK